MKPETHGDETRRIILKATLKLWANDPARVTVRAIAGECGLSHGAILYHFGTVENLLSKAATRAVVKGCSRVIIQLIATRHPAVNGMNKETRHQHMVAAGNCEQ